MATFRKLTSAAINADRIVKERSGPAPKGKPTKLGRAILARANALGIQTRREIADRLGIRAESLYRRIYLPYRAGRHHAGYGLPRVKTRRAIAEFLGWTDADLIRAIEIPVRVDRCRSCGEEVVRGAAYERRRTRL